MEDFKLEKSMFEGDRYYYLSKEDSDMYDRLKDSDDPKDKIIVNMILDKAYESYLHIWKASRSAHCLSRY